MDGSSPVRPLCLVHHAVIPDKEKAKFELAHGL